MLNAVQHQTHHCTINHQTKYFHKAGRQQKLHAAAEASDNDNNNFRYSDWKQDVGERARRIYDWWRVVMNEKRGVPTFQEAVRAIATTQVSSAAVERVFSQLTFIRRVIGDSAT
jgi:hypothetical protein